MLWLLAKRATLFCGFAGATVLALDHQHVIDLTCYPAIRAARTGFVVASIVGDYKWTLWNIDKNTPMYASAKSQVHSRSAKRLLNLCWRNRGTYVKVGQHLGGMDYLLPEEYTNELKILHSNAPTSTVKEIEEVIKEDLNVTSIGDLFSTFETKPLGTASLAQVHKATLKSDGSCVAVKVQHPRVRDLADKDMNMMDGALQCIPYFFPEFDLLWLGEETRRNLPVELDFTVEAANAERVASNLKKFDWVAIPKIYKKYSTSRVLVMEFMNGGQVNDMEYFKDNSIDCNHVSKLLGKLYSEMIFIHGFVHCDPHPGNIFVRWKQDESTFYKQKKLQLVLLDHGLYRELSDNFRYHYANLWQSIINTDVRGIETHCRACGSGEMYPLLATIVTGRAWKVVGSDGIKEVKFTQDEDNEIRSNAGSFLPHISQVLNRVPREMLLVLKANDHLRGLEHLYGVRGHSSGFLDMSRCCLRALHDFNAQKLQEKQSKWETFLSLMWCHLILYTGLLKITAFEWFLWFQEKTSCDLTLHNTFSGSTNQSTTVFNKNTFVVQNSS